MVERGGVRQGFLVRWGWGSGVVLLLNRFVLTDYILYEKKATNISTDARAVVVVVVVRKRAQRETPIYACNNVSDWLLRISGPL